MPNVREIPLLEREPELKALAGQIEDAAAHEGRLVLLEGPAGIGKTRLLAEARALAEDYGLRCLLARPSELERGFPFGVVGQLFEPPVRLLSSAERRRVFAGPAALAAPIVGLTEPRRPPAAEGLFPALHGLYWACAGLSERQPLFLAVDDAHWCDEASLRWLAFLTQRLEDLSALVVLALRTSEPGAKAPSLDALRSDPRATVMRLAPLSQSATSELLGDSFGSCPDQRFVHACHHASGGNPFLLHELARTLADDGLSPSAESSARVPEVVPDAVSRSVLIRLGRLSSAARRVAQAVAVLGKDPRPSRTAALAGLGETEARDAAAELATAGILEGELPLRFSHPLVQTAVYTDIPTPRRAADHATAARLLHADGAAIDEVAAHVRAASPAGDAWAVERLCEAAARAVANGALGGAAVYLQRALAEPPAPELRCEILHRLGSAEIGAGSADGTRRLQQALGLAVDPRARAAIARELARALFLAGQVAEALGLLGEAIDAAPHDRETALLLEAELLVAAAFAPGSRELLGPAVERHRDLRGATPGERLVLAGLAVAQLGQPAGYSAAETAALAQRALANDRGLPGASAESPLWLATMAVLASCDRFDLLEECVDEALEQARAQGSAVAFACASIDRCGLRYWQGALQQAEADGRFALQAVKSVGLHLLAPVALGYLLLPLTDRGLTAEGERLLDEAGLTEQVPDTAVAANFLLARGRLRIAQGRLEEGLGDLLEIGRCSDGGSYTPMYVTWRSQAAATLAALGRYGEAQELADAELADARAWGSPLLLALALRGHGHAERGPDRIELLREAVGLLRDSVARLEEARTLVELGTALRHTNLRKQARAELEHGMELAHRCGAPPLVERAREELHVLGAKPRKPVFSGADALTASERRITEMAATGLTNPEIAQALFVTRKTVEMHLSHAYRKLGIGSRNELTSLLGDEAAASEAPHAQPVRDDLSEGGSSAL